MPTLITLRIALAGVPLPFPGPDPVGEVRASGPAPRAPAPPRRRRPRPATGAAGIRSATCSTARSSDTLMCSPRNMASRRSATPDSAASSTSSRMVSSVTRFLE